MRVLVFCASSQTASSEYAKQAARLGELLAKAGDTIIYGGGTLGSMGALASGALARGGEVVGIQPRFMNDLGWGHKGLSELRLVDDMNERKQLMLDLAEAVVALPGGSGTFEELLVALTEKRLGKFLAPIVIVNQAGFYDPLIAQLERAIEQSFMDVRHRKMWEVVERVDQVRDAIAHATPWTQDAISFASV